MILPNRTLTLEYSLLYCCALILEVLKDLDTVSSLREKTRHHESLTSYEKFVLTMDFLFIIGAISLDNDGLVVRCANA